MKWKIVLHVFGACYVVFKKDLFKHKTVKTNDKEGEIWCFRVYIYDYIVKEKSYQIMQIAAHFLARRINKGAKIIRILLHKWRLIACSDLALKLLCFMRWTVNLFMHFLNTSNYCIQIITLVGKISPDIRSDFTFFITFVFFSVLLCCDCKMTKEIIFWKFINLCLVDCEQVFARKNACDIENA